MNDPPCLGGLPKIIPQHEISPAIPRLARAIFIRLDQWGRVDAIITGDASDPQAARQLRVVLLVQVLIDLEGKNASPSCRIGYLVQRPARQIVRVRYPAVIGAAADRK